MKLKSYSVTTILNCFSDFSKIPPHILEAAIERGNVVHSIAADYANSKKRGTFFAPTETEHFGFFVSYRKWFDACVREVLFVETRFFDSVLGYDGKVDLVAELVDGRTAVIDIKTPIVPSKTWAGQIAALIPLAKQYLSTDRKVVGMAVQPKKDGRAATAITYKNSDADFAAFVNALTAFRYFKD
jgi:hypothetical protein